MMLDPARLSGVGVSPGQKKKMVLFHDTDELNMFGTMGFSSSPSLCCVFHFETFLDAYNPDLDYFQLHSGCCSRTFIFSQIKYKLDVLT
jgi:hypothetical protein